LGDIVSAGPKPLVVEFLGTPGAGKTTLMAEARAMLQEQGYSTYAVVDAARPFAQRTFWGSVVNRLSPMRYRNPLLWQVFYYLSGGYRYKFSSKHRQLKQYVTTSQEHRPVEAAVRERRVLYWFNRLMGSYEFLMAHARDGEALVFDDGFVHRAVHLHASVVETPDLANVRAYVDMIPQPDIVIVPRVPLDLCELRIVKRGVWEYLRNKSLEDLRKFLINAEVVMNATVDHIKAKGWQVVEVDNGGDDTAAAIQELERKLLNIIPPRPTKISIPWIPHLPRPSRLVEFVKSRSRSLDIELETVQTVLDRFDMELIEPPSNLPLSRRTRNLLVNTSTGRKVLKRYRVRLEKPALVYSHSILERLAELNFPAPRLSMTPNGDSFVSLESGNYALFDFVNGENYSLSFVTPVYRYKLMHIAGKALARLHHALDGFLPEGSHHLGFVSHTEGWRRDLAWHSAKVDEMKERSQSLNSEDKVHADWLVQNCRRILDELGQLDETLRQSALPRLVIHGDYGLHNVVFDRRRDTVTPIDFESSRLEWRLSDLVSALSRLRYRGGVYNFESIRSFLKGYQSEGPISGDEWQYLPLVWRFHKLRASLIYWNSYFETGGPARKLISARDAVSQAEWVVQNRDTLLRLNNMVSI
jgi:Ser/Thr protein kinase RdoA (MazF antagonist)